jgi:hypothetical protein
MVSIKSMEAAVLARVPKGTEKLNRDALKAGVTAAKLAKRDLERKERLPEIPKEDLFDSY